VANGEGGGGFGAQRWAVASDSNGLGSWPPLLHRGLPLSAPLIFPWLLPFFPPGSYTCSLARLASWVDLVCSKPLDFQSLLCLLLLTYLCNNLVSNYNSFDYYYKLKFNPRLIQKFTNTVKFNYFWKKILAQK
jgi:hypothetical protein